MESWVQDVIAKWSAEGVKLNPPADPADIAKVESVLGFYLPKDFREFYLTVNGFHGLDWQEHMFTFWPLQMIIEEFERESNKNFIGFCDYLIASHCIGYNRECPGIYKSYELQLGKQIANTFQEVVSMINSNSKLIY